VQVRVTLSRARKAVKEAGDDVPEWLKPQTAGLDVGSEVSQFGVGTGIGAQAAQDIDGDGKISLAERAAGAAAGYGVIKGGARLSRKAGRGVSGAGGKGRAALPMDEPARMARAKADGFDTETVLYHGTATNVSAFDPRKAGGVTKARSAKLGTWLTSSPKTADGYADFASGKPVQDLMDASYAAERAKQWDKANALMAKAEAIESSGGSGQNIMPLYVKGKIKSIDMDGVKYDPDDVNLSEMVRDAKREGFDGLKLKNFSDEAGYGNYEPTDHIVIFDPKNIRSKFAKFDPDERNSAVLSAGISGRPPKKRLGRGLDSLMDDAAPVRSPASKAPAGNALAPQPRTGADWTEAERKAFINSGHEEGLIPIEPDSSFVTVKAARKSIKKLGIDYRVGDTNDYESGFPVLASVLGAGGVTAGTLGLLSAYLNQRPKSNVPPEMAKARAKLADTAATAYQKDPNGDEFRNTMIRLQQMDRKIEGGSEAEPRSPSYKPRKLSPSPAGITGEMLKRAGQKTGNALAMTEGKMNTGAERAAGYVRDRLRTAELPKRPIDLLKESEMKRNRQGQFVRDMETKRANDALWQRNGYTGYRGRKMTPAELRAQGKGSR
jgi:hypothetical protein